MSRTFDWAPHHDPRSLDFPIMGIVKPVVPHNKAWGVPTVPLDQGQEGACVGFGWSHEALAAPVKVVFSAVKALISFGIASKPANDVARWVYHQAQKVDDQPGENYEGTSVNAGAKVMRSLGLIKSWRWCFSVDDIIQALCTTGPVVLGIPWLEGMYEAPNGIVSATGPVVGGHCILARAYAVAGDVFPDEPAIGLFNSWGPSWGNDGQAWIRVSDLKKLLAQQGEAAVPLSRSLGH